LHLQFFALLIFHIGSYDNFVQGGLKMRSSTFHLQVAGIKWIFNEKNMPSLICHQLIHLYIHSTNILLSFL
jgi:hypothetical protein